MRKPIAKGFYPFNKKELEEVIKSCFLSKFGPGELPKHKNNEKLLAGIVPHAGYIYSGPCAAFTYKKLYENYDFETIIIIGTNHSGLGNKISLLSDKWETPFGIVDVDLDFIKYLIKNSEAVEDIIPHLYEHSIEVQLPFLQFLLGNKFKIVPILMKDLEIEEVREFVKIIKEGSEELNRKVFLLSSGDFTHHGEIYDYVIFNENEIENVKKLDLNIINYILKLDSEGFMNEIKDKTVCGVYPFLSFIEYTKLFNGRVELLKYYNSGEITGEKDIIVGYASIISLI